jgi:Family of unknown function (DUF6527)
MIKLFTVWLFELFKRPYTCKFIDEIPDNPKRKVVYFIGHDEYYWKAVLICPCGCNKILQMNLMNEYDPFWKYKIEKNNRVTLSPSIHRIVGCKSHFFIRKGKIIWV